MRCFKTTKKCAHFVPKPKKQVYLNILKSFCIFNLKWKMNKKNSVLQSISHLVKHHRSRVSDFIQVTLAISSLEVYYKIFFNLLWVLKLTRDGLFKYFLTGDRKIYITMNQNPTELIRGLNRHQFRPCHILSIGAILQISWRCCNSELNTGTFHKLSLYTHLAAKSKLLSLLLAISH